MFSLDTESGFDQVVFITASYGLGETVVQGAVNPDEFYVYKPALEAGRPAILRRTVGSKLIKMCFADSREAGRSVRTLDVPEAEQRRFSITDAEVEELARYATIIERHYGRPMDIEWGRDGEDGKLYILQARPETVKAGTKLDSQKRFRLKSRSEILVSGRAIGNRVGIGPVRLVLSASEMSRVEPGDVLLLCSDGLTTMIPDEEIARVVGEAGTDVQKAARALVAAANAHGGEDNITVLLLRFES